MKKLFFASVFTFSCFAHGNTEFSFQELCKEQAVSIGYRTLNQEPVEQTISHYQEVPYITVFEQNVISVNGYDCDEGCTTYYFISHKISDDKCVISPLMLDEQ